MDKDADRITDVYVGCAEALRRFISLRIRDAVAADDIVQESFLRLALEARAGRYPRQPRAWLYRVANNLIISRARRTVTAQRALVQNPPATIDLETPESRFLAVELHGLVTTALDVVGARGRRGLMMQAQGFTGREIAAVLGSSEGAARTLMSRARSGVRRSLALNGAV